MQEDVVGRIAVARRAARTWRRASVAQRVDALRGVWAQIAARRAEAVSMIVAETGASAAQAELVELGGAALVARHFTAGAERLLGERAVALPWFWANKRASSVRQPRGVIGVLTPASLPFLLPFGGAFRALLAGNAALLKPAPGATRTALWLESAVASTGLLPEGLLTVVAGGAAAGEDVVDACDLIVFSGSAVAARAVCARAAAGLKTVLLELGGKTPMIVCADASLERAAAAAVLAALAGRGLVAAGPVLVEAGARAALVEKIRARQTALGVTVDIPVTAVERAEEAVALANADGRCPAASVWTADGRRAASLASGLDADMIGVNEPGARAARDGAPLRDESLLALTWEHTRLEHEWPVDRADAWWSARDGRRLALLRRLLGLRA